jgi:DNA repair protein RecN (Recombination protein N)
MVGRQTLSTVTPIEHEARVVELARMLGGSEKSEISLAHARELLTP